MDNEISKRNSSLPTDKIQNDKDYIQYMITACKRRGTKNLTNQRFKTAGEILTSYKESNCYVGDRASRNRKITSCVQDLLNEHMAEEHRLGSDALHVLNRCRHNIVTFDTYNVPETVIIDESSMLTEEMFGALMQALKHAKRILFVGDPNQLPPIGAGRPFVDLVDLLRLNLQPGAFPRVCRCYGELTVNRRQSSDEERLDVELSKMFTRAEDAPDDDVMADIEKGNSRNISFVQWSTKEDLEEKLLTIISSELKMKNPDDQEGFDLALGGVKKQYGVYFDKGAAESADKWQILAPVRNMPHGVININRLLHLKYRDHWLKVSKYYGRYKKIPKALGDENIVYGDKVINIINSQREAWPKDGSKNYVANGEIGIACNYYVGKPIISK